MLVVAGGADAALQLIAATEVRHTLGASATTQKPLFCRCLIMPLAQNGGRQIPCLGPGQEARVSLWQVRFHLWHIWT